MCSTPCPGDAAMTCGSIADDRWSLFHAVDYRDPSTMTPSSSAKATFAITNSTSTSAAGYMTSTFYSTKVLTITSCAAAVTDCPARLSTTSYPVSTSVYPLATSTVYATKVFTVTSCAAAVVNCPARVGTTSYPVSTTVYPVACMNCTMPKPAVAISPAGPVNATTAASKSTNAAVLGSTVPSNTPKPTAAATNTVSSVPYKGLATTVSANSFGLLVTLVGVMALF
jgi:chitinase